MQTRQILVLAAILALWAVARSLNAQVRTDGTLGPRTTLSGPNFTIGPSLGQQRGGNLFHSFDQFNLSAGQTATFTGAASIRYVFARVTGGQPSSIDGTITCTIPNASFFLINPNGVVFGPDAALDVKGSFAVTTAGEVKLGSAGTINASHPSASVLNTAAPNAFGFLSASPAALNLNGANLSVPAGKSITVAAGDVSISGSRLSSRGGLIAIASVDSSGTAELDSTNPVLTLQCTSFSRLGAVAITNGAVVSTDGANGPGGRIEVQSNSMTVDNSRISANTTGPGNGRGIDLSLRDGFTTTDSTVASDTDSSGSAGDLQIAAGSLAMYGGTIETNTTGTGAGGNLTVNVAGKAVVDGLGNPLAGITALTTDAGAGGGAAGGLTVNAGSMVVRAGATLNASSFGTGNCGPITVHTVHDLILDSTGAIPPGANVGEQTGIGSGSFLSSSRSGDAGVVNVSARNLTIFNGGQIDASSDGGGNDGDINIKVSSLLTMDGTTRARANPTVFTSISAENDGADNQPGEVTVDAGALTLRDAIINAQTLGAGAGGVVAVNVARQTLLDGTGFFILPDPAAGNVGFATGIFSGSLNAIPPGTGLGGDAVVRSGSLVIERGAGVDTTTFGAGNAGKVTVSVRSLIIRNGGGIASLTDGSGTGGDITVGVSGTAFLDGSATPASLKNQFGGLTGVAVDTFSSGRGGEIHFRAGNTLTVTGGAEINSLSNGSGAAGSVSVFSKSRLTVSDGGTISASSTASTAGDVGISSNGTIFLDGGNVSAQAQEHGGNVSIASPLFIQLVHHASIATRSGAANGGDISLNALEVSLAHSQITANAPQGVGGNIAIDADATPGLIFSGPLADVTATGATGVSGNISTAPANTDIARSLARLSTELQGTELTLQAECGMMFEGNISSFIVTGVGATGIQPGEWLPALELRGPTTRPK